MKIYHHDYPTDHSSPQGSAALPALVLRVRIKGGGRGWGGD